MRDFEEIRDVNDRPLTRIYIYIYESCWGRDKVRTNFRPRGRKPPIQRDLPSFIFSIEKGGPLLRRHRLTQNESNAIGPWSRGGPRPPRKKLPRSVQTIGLPSLLRATVINKPPFLHLLGLFDSGYRYVNAAAATNERDGVVLLN